MTQESVNKTVLIIMLLAISALFFSMIEPFIMAIVMAGLFSAMARPVYTRLNEKFNNRHLLASSITLVLMIVVVLLPLSFLIGLIFGQAIDVGQAVAPWIKQQLDNPNALATAWQDLPFYEYIQPYREPILEKAGELVGLISNWIVSGLSQATIGTVNFVFMAFVFLYIMYFFQMDGDKLVRKILYYLPLNSADESLMMEKLTSVTRATLKGTFVIGALQGGLAGIAFYIAGIENAVFWGTVMAVMSVIPNIGSGLIWFPACVILILQGNTTTGMGLMAFCGLVVGSLDNVLRPILVGKDTKMHELMTFLGTLGGIMMFGISGIIIGPLIASLFVTIWELYGIAFRDHLPEVHFGEEHSPAKEQGSEVDSPVKPIAEERILDE